MAALLKRLRNAWRSHANAGGRRKFRRGVLPASANLEGATRWTESRRGTRKPVGGLRAGDVMRALVVLMIYLIGVGVALAPTIRAKWNSVSAADFAMSVGPGTARIRLAGDLLSQHHRRLRIHDGGLAF